MKVFTLGILGIFLSASVSLAGDCTALFSWLPDTGADVAGYKIHYGFTSGGPYTGSVDVGKPTPVNGRIEGAVSALTCDNNIYFVTSSYNSIGAESKYSNQVKLFVTSTGSSGGDVSHPFIMNIASN